MSQMLQTPEQWADEDRQRHIAATDKRSEQQVGIFLAVARVLKKWPEPPAATSLGVPAPLGTFTCTRADYDAGMEAAKRCS